MLKRRFILTAAGALLANPVLAQGKKGNADNTVMDSGPGMAPIIAGTYVSNGLNPDGSAYSGQCTIQQNASTVTLDWQIADTRYSGNGVIEGRVVTVDWGEVTPVVYVIMPDGTLHGTWADGTALEKLTPQ